MHRNASPMGQIYLGFRSLLVKVAIFVVMAALLAWALGGTLWPRVASRQIGAPAIVDGTSWVLVDQIGGVQSTFGLARLDEDGGWSRLQPDAQSASQPWDEAMPPVASPDGTAGAFAKRFDTIWTVVLFTDGERGPWGDRDVAEVVVRDRWEASRRLETFATSGRTALPPSVSDQPSDSDVTATGDASSAG